MKQLLFIIITFTTFLLNAQKIEEKTIENNNIKSVIINGDSVFKLEVTTTKTNIIKIKSKIEGEHANHVFLITKTDEDTLILSTDYSFLHEMPDDKLSAHKVLSVEITMEIPENLNLNFTSAIASAKVSGNYNNLILELNQGNADIKKFNGHATINTQNGDINLETINAFIIAKTKTGKVTTEAINGFKNEIAIQSIHGNINIYKTKI